MPKPVKPAKPGAKPSTKPSAPTADAPRETVERDPGEGASKKAAGGKAQFPPMPYRPLFRDAK